MARKTTADTFRQHISAALNRESVFYKAMFGAGDVLPVVKIDRGDCESYVPPMVEYETEPVATHCEWRVSRTEKYDGDSSFRLRKTSGPGLRSVATLTDSSPGMHGLLPGNTYRLSCYMRVPNELLGNVYLGIQDDVGASRRFPVSGFLGDWQRVEVQRTLAEGATSVELGVYVSQDVALDTLLYFDNFELQAESTVVSRDFQGGALFNEIELARFFGRYYTDALNVVRAQQQELTRAANRYLELHRGLEEDETDADYLIRFRSLVISRLNRSRTTKWAIIDALSYFIEPARIQLIERFNVENNKFRMKFYTLQGELSSFPVSRWVVVARSHLDNAHLYSTETVVPPTQINDNIRDTLLRVKAAGVDVVSSDVVQRNITIPAGAAFRK